MSTLEATPRTADEIQTAERFLADRQVEMVRVEWSDLHGVSRGKQMSRGHFLEALRGGTTFSSAALQMDLQGDAHLLPEQSSPPAWGNVVAIPDPSTLRPFYGAEDSARCLADLYNPDGSPVALSPRQALKSVIERGQARGVEAMVGLEMEFYLLGDSGQEPAPGAVRQNGRQGALARGRHVYRMQNSEEEYRFLEPLRRQMAECEIQVEAFCAEDGPGQFEIILGRSSALAIADAAFAARSLVKELAARQGITATFMSRPLAEHSGSGCHIHQSLWSTEGECLFLAGDGAQEALFWAFLSGQLAHFEESAALYLPTINSYKRIALRQPEPLLIDWAFEDRSAAIRVLGKTSGRLRVENRAVAGEANPYLSLATSLACGFGGLESAAVATPPIVLARDQKVSAGRPFPPTLEAALDLLDRSTLLREWIGADLIGAFVAVKRAEVRRFNEAVTDWELQEYLHDL